MFRFLRAVARHWGSLVTSGAIIGAIGISIGIWEATGHHVPAIVYWAIGVVGLFFAFYRAWNEERNAKEKALAARTDAEVIAAKARDWNTEWMQYGDRFKEYTRWFVRANWQKHAYWNNEEGWELSGDPATCNHLGSLCRLIGEFLLASPAVSSSLPAELRSQSDAIARWCAFLKSRGEMRQNLPVYEEIEGKTFGIYTGSIENLADASQRACIDCAAMEFRIMRDRQVYIYPNVEVRVDRAMGSQK